MPRCWTCGSEVPGGWFLTCPKCESIKRSFQDVHEIARTSSASVERLTEIGGLLEEQRDAVQNLAPELHGIASAIEWGFFELSWLLEQQTDVLQEISRKMSQPSQIQATEWRKMAEALRARGVYDQALDFFSKALEANPLDYQAYIGAGSTYLHLSQHSKAEKLFHDSIPHALKVGSFDYGSYSLRLIARIKYCEPDIDQAISFVERAITLSPDYWKAYYDLAQYCAVAGDLSKSEGTLRTAIEADSRYFSMAESEQDFNPLEDVLEDLKSV